MDSSYDNLLITINNLYSLEEAELDQFLKITNVLKLNKGDFYIKPGLNKQQIGFINSGIVRHFIVSEQGDEVTTDFCVEGEFTSVPNPFSDKVDNSYWIEALTPVEVISFKASEIERLAENYPAVDKIIRKIMVPYFEDKGKREIELLTVDALERYKKFLKRYPGVENQIPQYYIASYLGISPETLSRIKKRLI